MMIELKHLTEQERESLAISNKAQKPVYDNLYWDMNIVISKTFRKSFLRTIQQTKIISTSFQIKYQTNFEIYEIPTAKYGISVNNNARKVY